MNKTASITEMTIDQVLATWPQTAAVFNRRQMACVGCPVANFYTVVDAANIYQVSLPEFLAELEGAIAEGAQGEDE